MALRRILRIDNPDDKKILTTHCHPVRLPNPALKQLVADMFETMHAASGVGLAAPQIASRSAWRSFQSRRWSKSAPMVQRSKWRPEQNFVLINPEIIKASDQEDVGLEGCLSLPGWYGEVPRAAWVTVEYTDLNGRRQRIRRATGLLGRALQHEIDHLDGILFTERIRDLSTLKDYSEEMAPTAAE
jgi:peptide deformylase